MLWELNTVSHKTRGRILSVAWRGQTSVLRSVLRYFGQYTAIKWTQPLYRRGAWRQQQEMSTGGCGISLDRDSVSKSSIYVLFLRKTCTVYISRAVRVAITTLIKKLEGPLMAGMSNGINCNIVLSLRFLQNDQGRF